VQCICKYLQTRYLDWSTGCYKNAATISNQEVWSKAIFKNSKHCHKHHVQYIYTYQLATINMLNNTLHCMYVNFWSQNHSTLQRMLPHPPGLWSICKWVMYANINQRTIQLCTIQKRTRSTPKNTVHNILYKFQIVNDSMSPRGWHALPLQELETVKISLQLKILQPMFGKAPIENSAT
jgi:hypothetical protein